MDDLALHLLQSYESRLSQVAIPVEAVYQLKTGNILIEKSDSDQLLLAGEPLRELFATIAKDHRKLKHFVSVLLKFTNTQSLAKDILDDYNQLFHDTETPECKQISELPQRPTIKHVNQKKEYAPSNEVYTSVKGKETEPSILTDLLEVKEFLRHFEPIFNVILFEENEHAKPGGILYEKFKERMLSLPKEERKTCLAFHGTSAANIPSICKNGYNPELRFGQLLGVGEYFATSPNESIRACGSGNKMILNELLLGKEGVHHVKYRPYVIVMKDPVHELPRFVLTFTCMHVK